MAKKPKPRNRAAQDVTLINLRAMKRRVSILSGVVVDLCRRVKTLERRK